MLPTSQPLIALADALTRLPREQQGARRRERDAPTMTITIDLASEFRAGPLVTRDQDRREISTSKRSGVGSSAGKLVGRVRASRTMSRITITTVIAATASAMIENSDTPGVYVARTRCAP
jgi:hypothetical protein